MVDDTTPMSNQVNQKYNRDTSSNRPKIGYHGGKQGKTSLVAEGSSHQPGDGGGTSAARPNRRRGSQQDESRWGGSIIGVTWRCTMRFWRGSEGSYWLKREWQDGEGASR